MYNSDTGFAKIEGNGYLESPDGSLAAPHIEGNLKQIKVVATGGVNLSSTLHNATGYGDQAVYTRTGRNGTDGRLVLQGNAWAVQNGNRFDGPELILMDNDKVVETKGRSTIVITNTGGSDNTAGSGSVQESAPTGPVTANTPIAGRPEYAGSSIETKEKPREINEDRNT